MFRVILDYWPAGRVASDPRVVRRLIQGTVLAAAAGVAYLFPLPALVLGFIVCCRIASAGRASGGPGVGTGAFGTATWATRHELLGTGLTRDRGGLFVGTIDPDRPRFWPAFKAIFLAPAEDSPEVVGRFLAAVRGRSFGPPPGVYLNRFTNVLLVAPPGAGKGAAVIIPNLLRYPHSVVCLDPKGENFTATAHVRGRLGQVVRRLDPFGVCGGPGADAYNPLGHLDPASPTLVDDCSAIADALVVKTGKEADPHWNESAVAAVTAFVLYVVAYAPADERNLVTVSELVTHATEFAAALAVMRDDDGAVAARVGYTPAYEALRRYGNQLSALVDRELGSVRSTVNRNLAWMNSTLVQDCLRASTFDPVELARQDTSLYLVLPPDRLESHNRLLRLWVTGACRGLVRNGLQEKRKVLFLLDEVGNVGALKALREGVTILRGYGARFFLCLQARNQMTELFGEASKTVLAGIDTQIFFGVRDHDTADEFSKIIGSTTVRSRGENHSTSTSTQGGSWALLFGGPAPQTSVSTTDGTTVTETGRRLVMAEELLRESERTVFVVNPAVRPFTCRQVRWYEDPVMRRLVATKPVASAVPAALVPAAPRALPAAATEPGRIRFACPCSKRYSLPAELAGRRARCKVCDQPLVVPAGPTA